MTSTPLPTLSLLETRVLGVLADAQVNVLDMSNRSRDALAYNIIDVEPAPGAGVIEAFRGVGNVIRVRVV